LLQKSFPLLLAWVWKHLCTFLASSSDLLWWWRKLCKSSIVSVQSFGLSVYVLKFLVRVCGMLCSSSRWFLHISFLFSFYTAI
jgi:hypothetical protein